MAIGAVFRSLFGVFFGLRRRFRMTAIPSLALLAQTIYSHRSLDRTG